MFSSYNNRFNKMFESINSDTMKTYAHLDKSNSFTGESGNKLQDG